MEIYKRKKYDAKEKFPSTGILAVGSSAFQRMEYPDKLSW
jgi:hypothetical protein